MPWYLHFMGAEAFGLVGFFLMMQAWFQLLDLGAFPTITREAARFSGGALSFSAFRRLLGAVEGFAGVMGIIGSYTIAVCAASIASNWLQVKELKYEEVELSIMLMAAIVPLRWLCGLYRGVLRGFEQLIWLSKFNVIISTARFVCVIPLLAYVSTGPKYFFVYQLVIASIEVLFLKNKVNKLAPAEAQKPENGWSWESTRKLLAFSLAIGMTSAFWIVVTQIDKLVLSKVLSLSNYGYFTMAMMVAGGLLLLSEPMGLALMPRLTKLAANGNLRELTEIYRRSTQVISVIIFPLLALFVVFPAQILWVWTGNIILADEVAPILALYAVGNSIAVVGAFPYYLQYAIGNLRLHFIGSIVMLSAFVPWVWWAAVNDGALGVGKVWVIANALTFLVFTSIVHRRYLPGIHLQWLAHDVGFIAISAICGSLILQNIIEWPNSRFMAFFVLTGLGLILLLVALLAATLLRSLVLSKFRKLLSEVW